MTKRRYPWSPIAGSAEHHDTWRQRAVVVTSMTQGDYALGLRDVRTSLVRVGTYARGHRKFAPEEVTVQWHRGQSVRAA